MSENRMFAAVTRVLIHENQWGLGPWPRPLMSCHLREVSSKVAPWLRTPRAWCRGLVCVLLSRKNVVEISQHWNQQAEVAEDRKQRSPQPVPTPSSMSRRFAAQEHRRIGVLVDVAVPSRTSSQSIPVLDEIVSHDTSPLQRWVDARRAVGRRARGAAGDGVPSGCPSFLARTGCKLSATVLIRCVS